MWQLCGHFAPKSSGTKCATKKKLISEPRATRTSQRAEKASCSHGAKREGVSLRALCASTATAVLGSECGRVEAFYAVGTHHQDDKADAASQSHFWPRCIRDNGCICSSSGVVTTMSSRRPPNHCSGSWGGGAE